MSLPMRNCRMMDRQRRVAALHLRGMTPEEIAERVGVDQATVSRDLQTLREQVQAEAELNIQELRALELMRIKLVEEQAWEEIESGQWIRDNDEKAERGNRNHWRYLEIALKCSVHRRRLLGLDLAPPEVKPAEVECETMSPEDRDRTIEDILKAIHERAEAARAQAEVDEAEPDVVNDAGERDQAGPETAEGSGAGVARSDDSRHDSRGERNSTAHSDDAATEPDVRVVMDGEQDEGPNVRETGGRRRWLGQETGRNEVGGGGSGNRPTTTKF